MKLIIALILGLVVGSANALDASIAAQIEAAGIENCHNKCDKVFDRLQYAISNQPGANTFEYRSCIIGCNQCNKLLSTGNVKDTCFNFCKTFNYGSNGIRKGIIEPDKACIMGCVINTCQEVCIGGTTENNVTPQNQQFFWNMGGNGCSIKGNLGYVQNANYGNPNAPVGPGASDAQRQCCSNAFNLCTYNGDKTTANFANVLLVAQRTCRSFAGSNKEADICTFFDDKKNCGTPGMNSFLNPA